MYSKNMTLSQYLQIKAVLKNMSMKELAIDMGLAPLTLANTKKRKPSNKTYHKICMYFHEEPEFIINLPIFSQ